MTPSLGHTLPLNLIRGCCHVAMPLRRATGNKGKGSPLSPCRNKIKWKHLSPILPLPAYSILECVSVISSPFKINFSEKDLLVYLTERQLLRERKIFYLLVHSPNGHNSRRGCARLKLEARNFLWVLVPKHLDHSSLYSQIH